MTKTPLRARLGSATDRRISVEVDGCGEPDTLEYTSPDPLWLAPPANLDFAAVALAQHAAAQGRDLFLEGPATKQQLERLDEYQLIWSVWRPDLFRRIRIYAEEEVDAVAVPERRGAVMGYSGGVDASFAVAAHATGEMGRLTRKIDLGVLVVGFDLRHDDVAALVRARASAAHQLDAYGIKLAVVHTNWREEFCSGWFMSFNAGITAILHTFSPTHSAAIHANDHSYRLELRMPPYGSNIAINHLLGNPTLPVISTGGTHRRIERVAFLGDHPALLEGLRVCYQHDAGGTNCGHCEKCVRTQLELRAVGLSAERAFPSPLTIGDIRRATISNPTVLMHFEDILQRLTPDDEFFEAVRAWVARQQLARTPRIRELTERVVELERQLQRSQEDVAALKNSRSWKVTRPMRAVTDATRRRR